MKKKIEIGEIKPEPEPDTTASAEAVIDVHPTAPVSDDPVAAAIADVQANDSFAHLSAEHLEVAVIRKLLEWGFDLSEAEHRVRTRLY
jgi:hypothetical protein